jgi:signal transduction histidine kinase
MQTTPQLRLSISALIVLVIIALAVHFALGAPMLDISLSANQENELVVQSVAAGSANAAVLEKGSIITHLAGIPVDSKLMIDEPDQLGAWSVYNQLLDTLTRLDTASRAGTIDARVDNRDLRLVLRSRKLADLPIMFWYQLLVGALPFFIAAGVYAFRPQEKGAKHFAFAGLSIFVSASMAAIYSTRELILNGALMHVLSIINELGALLFTSALVALLWVYPRSIFNSKIVTGLFYLVGLVSVAGFAFQWFADTSGVYSAVLALFSVSFVFAFLQWRKTSNSPVERAALKWYLLSIYLGTGLFAAAILIPSALGVDPPASQGLMFAVFLFMFVGIAFGITRYRLFDLDRWWLTAWSWFFGGAVVLGLDAILVSMVGMNHSTSLALALALIGWVYFPLRQWLFGLLRKNNSNGSQQISRLVQNLFSAEEPEQLSKLWQQHLEKEWEVLESSMVKASLSEPSIGEDAQSLSVPDLIEGQYFNLYYPFHGSRLFTSRDQRSAVLLYKIAEQAMQGLLDRLQALEERRRIFGDLHDDVGSKLLSLLYRSKDPATRELARTALEDLRDVVSQPEEGFMPILDMWADLRAEAQDRLDGAGIELCWQQAKIKPVMISVFRKRHITRVVRELINNVIKHAAAQTLEVNIDEVNDQLKLIVADDGCGKNPEQWSEGRGMSNIRHRVQKMNGSCAWSSVEDGGCRVEVMLPVEESPVPA